MTDPFEPDDRISAYLDGECSPEEEAEVRTFIATDPEWRQAYAETKAVRARLRSEPWPVAPAGWWDDVRVGVVDATSASATDIEARRSRRFGWVRWVGGGVAVAAAMVLFVVLARPDSTPSEPVAASPRASADAPSAHAGFTEFFGEVRRGVTSPSGVARAEAVNPPGPLIGREVTTTTRPTARTAPGSSVHAIATRFRW